MYEPKGEYQIVCEHMEPHGLGALQLAFEQLKKKLQAEGLFDAARKRPLPSLPRKIGIVTSLDGAALRDIIKVLRRRHPNAHLVIRPARVQGDGAAADVAQALRAIVKVPGVDVVIVGRGGGSLEDLRAFNQEIVARAIAASPVPVISAVGHEMDVTIADFVADLRAPTPSAAAEMVVAAKDEFCRRIDRLAQRLTAVRASRAAAAPRGPARADEPPRAGGMAGAPRDARPPCGGADAPAAARGDLPASPGATRATGCCGSGWSHAICGGASRRIRTRLGAANGRLDGGRGARAPPRRVALHARSPAGSRTSVPLAVLARGYAVCWNEDRTAIVRRAATVSPGDRVHVTLHDGEIECEVQATAEELRVSGLGSRVSRLESRVS